MKLYAKTTSNRASKGQGGDYLAIEITDGSKELLWHIYAENNRLDLSEWDNIQKKAKLILRTFKEVEKGNNQKGETYKPEVHDLNNWDNDRM